MWTMRNCIPLRHFSIASSLNGNLKPPKIGTTAIKNTNRIMTRLIKKEQDRLKRSMIKPKPGEKIVDLLHGESAVAFQERLMEDLGLVMSKIKSLVGHGIIVTMIETDKQMNRLIVFWATSRPGEDEEVKRILEQEEAGDIRYGLHQRGQWATLPQLIFSEDVALIRENVMEDLFKRADIGPGSGDVASDIVISKDSDYSLDNFVKNLKMNTDELGVDRDKIFYNIEVSVERSCAKHRQVEDDKVDEFSELYVRSLSSSNVRVVEKKERASKIKKFLAERRQNKEA